MITMEPKTWTFIDKSKWGDGPWQSEPDKAQFVDDASGLDCLTVRHSRHGHLCGYVGVSESHPLFGKDDSQIASDCDLRVHGGVTFTDFCQEDKEHGICHVAAPGRPEKVWWIGFDCAHGGDMSPGMAYRYGFTAGEQYRDLEYVKAECASLAQQLAAMPPPPPALSDLKQTVTTLG